MNRIIATLAVMLATGSVQAQYGNLGYNFFGPAGSQEAFVPAAITNTGTVTFTGVTNQPVSNMLNSGNWETGSINLGQYYSLSFTTVNPVSIPSISLHTLSSNSGPSVVEVRSSFDNFGSSLGSNTITPGVDSFENFSLPSSTFGNIAPGTDVTFRIYGYSATVSDATSQLGFLSFDDTENSILLPINPVPEPATLGGLATLGLIGFGWVRRRVAKRA